MKALYIAWQDPQTRRWHTVGRLSALANGYRFAYTRGALASPRFQYLGRMQDTSKTYYAEEIFPLFANRLLDASRPEYPAYLEWMGLDGNADALEHLARSGGRRGTDQLCVYPEVEADEQGEMTLYFFSHGLRYLSSTEQQAIRDLQPGEALQLTTEDDNTHDRYALVLETRKPVRVGYCPRYLNQDLRKVQGCAPIHLIVERINPMAPLQFRLLCKATFTPPEGLSLYDEDEHQVIGQLERAA